MFSQVIKSIKPSMALGIMVSAVCVGSVFAALDDQAPKPADTPTPPAATPPAARPARPASVSPSATPPVTRTTPPTREELLKRTRDAKAPDTPPADGARTHELVRSGEVAPAGPPVIRFDPETADFGEMIIEEKKTIQVKICNISEVPVTIKSAKPSCGCTAAGTPKDPIAPGACAEVSITLSPGSRAPASLNKRVTYEIEGHSPMTLNLKGQVMAYVMAEPTLVEEPTPEQLASDEPTGAIKLTSGDGTPFRITEVVPPVVLDFDKDAAPTLEKTVHVAWPEWEKAGKQIKFTIKTDHPKTPSIPIIVKKVPAPGAVRGAETTTTRELPNPLLNAVREGNIEKVKEALAADRDSVNTPDRLGRLPLNAAAGRGDVETVKLLLEAGADFKKGEKTGKAALAAAAEEGRLEVVKLLLAAGAEVDQTDQVGGTAFLWASGVRNSDPEVLKVLLAAGANPNVSDVNGLTPLLWNAAIGDPACMKVLLEQKVNINAPDKIASETALMRAVRSGKPEGVKQLLAAGAKVDEKNRVGSTALLLSAAGGSLEKLKMIVEAKPDLNARDAQGMMHLESRPDSQ